MLKRFMELNNVNLNTVYYSNCGDITLELDGGDNPHGLLFSTPWFYSQVSIDSVPDRLCGLYEFVDDDLINYIYSKSQTMLRVDLAKHYKVVFSNLMIDIVITGKMELIDACENSFNCFLDDEIDLKNSEYIANLTDIFSLITGNIEFDDNERFVVDSELSFRFQRPIEIDNMIIGNNRFNLFLTTNHGKAKYEIFSNKMPNLIQFADELVTDDAFSKTHKRNEALGALYEVQNSSISKKIENVDSDLKILRIEDSEIPMDIVTSNSLFYRKINDSKNNKWNTLMLKK